MRKVFIMIKKSITIQETVDFLNELLKIDSKAIESLFNIRIFCNNDMMEHPTVQVSKVNEELGQLGIIGILNGLFKTDRYGWGHIAVSYNKNKIEEFKVLTDEYVKKIIEKNKK